MPDLNSNLNPALLAGYSLAADQNINGITPENSVPVSLGYTLDSLANDLNIAQGAAQYIQDKNAIDNRSALQQVNDYAGRAVQGLESIGYIPAGIAGALQDLTNIGINVVTGSNYDTGHTARYLGNVSDFIKDTGKWGLTSAAQARQRAIAAESQARDRASELQYQKDLARDKVLGRSSFGTELSKVGRDAVNAAKALTEPEEAVGLAAEGVGQILGQSGVASLVGRGIRALGRTASKASVDKFANEYGSKIDTVSASANIGLSEAGGGAAQVIDEIDNMSMNELYAVSPKFTSLVQEYESAGLSKQDAEIRAKEDIKNESVLQAYGISVPGSLLASRLATGMVERPFGRITNNLAGTRAQALDILGETVEEASTNVASGLINNAVAQANYDTNRNLSDNLGQNLVEGAAGGFLPSVALRTPSLTGSALATSVNRVGQVLSPAARTVGNAASVAGSAIKDKVAPAVGGALNRATSAINTYAQNQKVKKATESIKEAETATPTSKEAMDMQNMFKDTFSNINYKGTGLSNTNADGSPKSTSQAFADLMNTVANEKADKAQRIRAAVQLKGVLNKLTETVRTNEDIKKAIDSKNVSENDAVIINNLFGFMSDNDSVRELNEIANGQFRKANQDLDTQVKANNFDNIKTAENREAALDAIRNSPNTANTETVQTIINHAEELGMSEQEKAAWNTVLDTIKNYKELTSTRNSNFNEITDQYVSSDNPDNYKTGKVSAKQLIDSMLVQASTNEFKDGDEVALSIFRDKLDNLRKLYEIANNKLQALKRSYNNGGTRETYTTYNPQTGKAYTYKGNGGVYANVNNAKSLDFMKEVSDTAKSLFGLYNNFISAYPKETSASGSIPAALKLTSREQLNLPKDFDTKYKNVGKNYVRTPSSSSSGSQSQTNTATNTTSEQDLYNKAIAAFNTKGKRFQTAFLKAQAAKRLGRRVPNGAALTISGSGIDLTVWKYILESTDPNLVNFKQEVETQTQTKAEPEKETIQAQEPEAVQEVIDTAQNNPDNVVDASIKKLNRVLNETYKNNPIEKHNATVRVARKLLFKHNDKSLSTLDPKDTYTEAFDKLNQLVANTFTAFKDRYKNIPEITQDIEKYLDQYTKSLDESKFSHHPVNIVISNLNSIFKRGLEARKKEDPNVDNVRIYDLLSDRANGVLTFTNKDDKGNITLDNNVQVAVGAATVGFVSDLNNFFGNKDIDQVSEEYSVDLNQLSSDDINTLAEGANVNLLVRNMNSRLLNLLGISMNNLPEDIDGTHAVSALSMLAIQNLIGMKILEKKTITLPNNDTLSVLVPGEAMGKNQDIYKRSRLTGIRKKLWNQATNTIENKREFFMDEEMPDVNTITKLRSRAHYTPQEKKAIEGHRRQKYYINTPFYNFMDRLGVPGLIRLFSTPFEKDENDNYPVINKNTKASIEGKNRTLLNSFVYNTDRYNIAKAMGGDDAYIRLDYRMTRNGRYQETLAYGPNSDKLSRQMFTVVHSKYNLNQREDRIAFGKTLLQAFGVDTKKVVSDQVYLDTESKLFSAVENLRVSSINNDFNKVTDGLQKYGIDFINYIANPVGFTQNLFDKVGSIILEDSNGKKLQLASEVSYLGINAFLNIFKAIDAVNNNNTNTFTMNVALEGDSTAAGIGDSTAKASSDGTFTANYVQTLRETGHMVGTDETYAESKELDPDDAYTRSAKLAMQKSNDFVKNNPEIGAISQDVIDLAALCGITGTYGDNDGKLTFTRQITKKMATPMTYQQGINSATVGILNMIGDYMHQHISNMLQAKERNPHLSQAEAFFDTEGYEGQEATNRFNALINKLDELSATRIKNENGRWIIDKDTQNQTVKKSAFKNFFNTAKKEDYQNFTFRDFLAQKVYDNNRNQENNLFTNIKYLFTKPMYDGVNEVRGQGVKDTGDSIIASSGIISLVQGYKTLKERRRIKKETGYNPSRNYMEKLQRTGLNSIYKFPESTTELELTGMNTSVPSGRPIDSWIGGKDSLTFQNRLFITGNPGVSPFPLTIVATTDGSIQTRLFSQNDFVGADRYDGLEYDAKDAPNKAKQMNQAARDVILDNILKPFAEKFNDNLDTLISSMKEIEDEIVQTQNAMEANDRKTAVKRAAYFDDEVYLQNLQRVKKDVDSIFRTYMANKPKAAIVNGKVEFASVNRDARGTLDYEKAFNIINDDLKERSNNIDRKLAVLKSTPMNEQHMSADNTRVGFGLENTERLAQYRSEQRSALADAQRTADIMNQRLKNGDNTIPLDSESMQRATYPSLTSYSGSDLDTLLNNQFKDNTEVSSFVKKFVKSNLNPNTKVIIGNRDDVTNYVRTYFNHNFDPAVTRGFAIPGSNTIIIVDAKSNKTVLAHELIHTVTSLKVAKLANIPASDVDSLNQEERLSWRALKNIEDLYGQFSRHVNQLMAINPTERNAQHEKYINLYHSIENAGSKANQLQEFMAYAMTDNRLRSYFRSNPAEEGIVTRIRNMNHIMQDIKDVFIKVRNAIGKFLHINIAESKRTGDAYTNKPTLNALTALEYSTAVIIDTNLDTNTNTDIDINVNHYTETDEDPRLSKVMKNIDKAVNAAINTNKISVSGTPTEGRVNTLKNIWDKDTGVSSRFNEFINEAQNNGFTLSTQQAQTMKMVMSVFNTGMGLNPILKVEAENLRKIVLDKLSSEDFLATSSSPEEAQMKYDLLANTSGSVINSIAMTRSNDYAASLKDASLALFMGLAIVSPEVRSVLEKLIINRGDYAESRRPVSKVDISKPDEILNKLGTRIVDFVTEQITHQPSSANAMKIVDSYIDTIKETSMRMNALNIPSNILAKGDAAITKYVLDKLPGIMNTKAYKALEEVSSSSKIANTILYALNMGISLSGSDTGEYASKQLTREITVFAAKNPGIMGRFLTVSLNELMFPDENMNTLQRIEKKYKTEMQIKRQVYRETVPNVILQQFADEGIELTKEDESILNTAYLKCDAGALSGSELNSVFGSQRERTNLKNRMEQTIAQNVSLKAYPLIIKKMNQLSNFMLTGKAGANLLRNADAIAHLLGENINPQISNEGTLIQAIDKWITINTLERMEPTQFKRVRDLYFKAPKASSYAISQQRALRTKEVNDARNSGSNRTRFNAYKGYVPFTNRNSSVVKVINATELEQYEDMGYTKVGNYTGPRIENSPNKVIVANSVNPIMSYATGAMPTTNMTVGGVDKNTGYMLGLNAGRIVNPAAIAQYKRNLYKDTGTENFSPVYDDNGSIIALERTLDPKYMNHLRPETSFAKNLGNWWGRQVEEEQAKTISKELVKTMHDMWENVSPREQRGYIDLWEASRNDKVLADALGMMSPEAKAEIRRVFGNKFMVRTDMVNDLLGHRRASIVDSFTGKSRFSPTTQKAIVNLARIVIGDKAFKKLYRTERFVMGTVSSARNWIVVRSLTVMVDNLVSNLFQLITRGIPITTIMAEVPQLLKQVEIYNNYRVNKIKLQADLQAARGEGTLNQYKINAIQNRIRALEESVRNLDIMPLIRAGEYNTIADVGDTPADLQLSMGNWGDYIEDKVNQLPKSIRTAGKYAIVSKDTALYRGLEKGVQYGDFIAKAILYKHLMQQPLANEQKVLDRVRYEFVNYDMLAGRSREYLENIGLLWFYNFKLRTTRVAFSMLRNNPLHALVFLGMPTIGDIGSPLTDNLLSKILRGGIFGSIGPNMGLDFFTKNLWGQMFL